MTDNRDMAAESAVSPQNKQTLRHELKTAEDLFTRYTLPALTSPHSNRLANIRRAVAEARWLEPELEDQAREHVRGVILAADNQLPQQAVHHFKNLVEVKAKNDVLTVLSVASVRNWPAKLFAVMKTSPSEDFQIKGPGTVRWQCESLQHSNVIIPTGFLERLSEVRRAAEPDGVFVAKAHAEVDHTKLPLSEAVADTLGFVAEVAGRFRPGVLQGYGADVRQVGLLEVLADPVLLVGYGRCDCMYLMEIARWD